MIERIKFSHFRDLFKLIKFYTKIFISKINKANYLWSLNFNNFIKNPNKKILIFAPSMTIDKPSYLNVGLRNLIEVGKNNNIEFEVLQCMSGLDICHLGGSPYKANNNLPCKSCTKVNNLLFKDLNITKLKNINLSLNLNNLSIEELKQYEYKGINIGKKSITTTSWILRTSEINEIHKEYLIKSIKSSIKLIDFLENNNMQAFSGILVFNGLTLPESIMYEWCKNNKLNVATFESGWSIKNEYALEFNYLPSPQHFFEYNNRDLSEDENILLDQYIENKRNLSKNFSPTDDKKIISIFGNVSWDTSQTISSNIFNSMYEWLDSLIPIIKENNDYLFVFRSHPGEDRKIKKTWYGLDKWYENNSFQFSNNTICYGAKDPVDSYEIILKSEIALVYNSTIGIESVIFGKKALAAANTHYSKHGFIDSYDSKESYIHNLNKIISEKKFELDENKILKARSYYFQLLNDVAYNFGNINHELNFNEHTLINNYSSNNEYDIDKLDNLLNSFLNKKPLEKKFNL